jgi:hypothetical protein
MSKRSNPWGTRRIYEFIKANRQEYDVKLMCSALGVSRSGYYAWLHSPISNRATENAQLLRLIRASYRASHGIYGSPRVFLDLREAGESCSKHRVARLMRVNKVTALHGYRTSLYRRKARGNRPRSGETQLRRRSAQQGLGHGYYVHSNVARLALSCCCHGSVLQTHRRLGCGTEPASRARSGCRTEGSAATTTAWHGDPLRSRSKFGVKVRMMRTSS